MTIGAGTSRTQVIRQTGQALREVSESYGLAAEDHVQPVAANEAAAQ